MKASQAGLETQGTKATEKKPKTGAERLAELKASKEKALARFAEREKNIADQERFGGQAKISQQKILLGSWLWKLAQTDNQVKNLAKQLIEKMDPESKDKMAKFIAVIDGKPGQLL